MKKNLKTILISGIASTLTAVIIFVSGGSTVLVALLGGAGIIAIPSFMHLNSIKNNKNNTSYIEQTDSIQNLSDIIIEDNELNQNDQVYVLASQEKDTQTRQSIPPIKQYDDNPMIQELITIDALSQKEDILVRIRKKETEERFKENDEHKK